MLLVNFISNLKQNDETRIQHSGIAQSSKHADTFTNGIVSPWVFFLQKVLAVKAPRDLYTLAMSRVSYKETTKTIMVSKNWTYKVGL
jgi:hypothetical protein